MRDLEFDNYYDPETRILHANWDEGFFSNTTTALWALTDLANEGISPKQIQCARGWDKYCDRSIHGELDLYPIFFRDKQNLATPPLRRFPRFKHHHRYALIKLDTLSAFVEKWFSPSECVLKKLQRNYSKYNFEPEKTIGVFYRGTDKESEVTVASIKKYLEFSRWLLERHPKFRILIQTDQRQARDLFVHEFKSKCFFLEEMPVTDGGIGLHYLPQSALDLDRIEFGKRVLAAANMLARCKILLNCTGNMALWSALYRGSALNMFQIDELGNISNPDGSNFTKNPLIVAYRKIKGALRAISS